MLACIGKEYDSVCQVEESVNIICIKMYSIFQKKSHKCITKYSIFWKLKTAEIWESKSRHTDGDCRLYVFRLFEV
mgnify:CR=1 FL=1